MFEVNRREFSHPTGTKDYSIIGIYKDASWAGDEALFKTLKVLKSFDDMRDHRHILITRWGKAGVIGQAKVETFRTRMLLDAAIESAIRARFEHGYQEDKPLVEGGPFKAEHFAEFESRLGRAAKANKYTSYWRNFFTTCYSYYEDPKEETPPYGSEGEISGANPSIIIEDEFSDFYGAW